MAGSSAHRVRLPADLAGPVAVALAKPVEQIPGPHALPGGCAFEPKWDGYRAVIVRADERAVLWSRQGTDLTDRFPDIAAAASRILPAGCVVDGELVMLDNGRLSFDQLQRRLVTSPAKARQLAAHAPASYMAFDLLAAASIDIRSQRWTTRRGRLESLAAWAPPLQLSPVTYDGDEAREWFDVLPDALGIEGLVVKGTASRYAPGRREWLKVKRRDTVDVIVGGVLGPIDRPDVVIAGRYRGAELVQVGRTVPLTAAQSAELGAVLEPAGPDHPWPDEIGAGRWARNSANVPLTKVSPDVVAEVTADAALQAGAWRHPLRYVRHRPDLRPDDVDPLD
ncbi:MAG TPA: ATP-dependent DNA ligase [Kribbellaceae bacterium]